jgi:dCMP deaminase
MKWDQRFVDLAKHIAQWSKDPSTQTDAVITHGKRVVSVGFNGLPPGIEDTYERLHNRELKYKIIMHCERNAMLYSRESLHGATLYTWPFMSCSTCASMVITAGIKRHVAPQIPADKLERWKEDMELSMQLFKEAGVEVCII